ncbi:hypothetical protein ACM26V_04125 [Salipaludibacillus sp. HK11]|uniref:hypothetical protein n=1 Tax=Salipaludibacillus sp. HK11 TaxID=3394320 RepID=UPI0039FBA2A7
MLNDPQSSASATSSFEIGRSRRAKALTMVTAASDFSHYFKGWPVIGSTPYLTPYMALNSPKTGVTYAKVVATVTISENLLEHYIGLTRITSAL